MKRNADLLRETYVELGGPENRWFDVRSLVKAAFDKDPSVATSSFPKQEARNFMLREVEAGRAESKLVRRRNKIAPLVGGKASGSTTVRKFRRVE